VKHKHYTDVEKEIPQEKGLKDVTVQWLISEKDGAEHFAMRLFELASGGYTPLHQHDWEHEVFILEGTGVVKDKTSEQAFHPGDVFFVPAMEWHQFVNTETQPVKFLCLIPYKK
jgi:quercetin dioxygenase-like cupin family protein